MGIEKNLLTSGYFWKDDYCRSSFFWMKFSLMLVWVRQKGRKHDDLTAINSSSTDVWHRNSVSSTEYDEKIRWGWDRLSDLCFAFITSASFCHGIFIFYLL